MNSEYSFTHTVVFDLLGSYYPGFGDKTTNVSAEVLGVGRDHGAEKQNFEDNRAIQKDYEVVYLFRLLFEKFRKLDIFQVAEKFTEVGLATRVCVPVSGHTTGGSTFGEKLDKTHNYKV